MTNIQEIWVPVNGHTGYEVSNFGNVRSIDRFIVNSRYPNYKIKRKGKCLSPIDNGKGYLSVRMGKDISNRKYIHRLVASNFLPNPNNFSDVNHIDGNKSNNCIDNLEWVSHADNQKHAGENLLMAVGERVSSAKLNKDLVIEIFNHAGKQVDIAAKYGLNRMHVGKIKRKEIWKHVHNIM